MPSVDFPSLYQDSLTLSVVLSRIICIKRIINGTFLYASAAVENLVPCHRSVEIVIKPPLQKKQRIKQTIYIYILPMPLYQQIRIIECIRYCAILSCN